MWYYFMYDSGIIVFFLFSLGAAIGSFLHVVSERYVLGENILGAGNNRSYCPHCKKVLTAWELIPIVSYIWSRARCRSCFEEIPFHYPVIELIMGVLAVGLLFNGHILIFLAACILVVLTRIDILTMTLPDRYIYLLTVISIVYVGLIGREIEDSIFGVLAGVGSLYLLWIGTGGRGIGFGDVKLMIPLGILFGLSGTVALLFFSFLVGGAVSIFLLASHQVTPKTAVPFGPFLAGSALFIILFPEVVDRFFSMMGV